MSSLYVDRRDIHLQHDAGAIAFYENGQRSATVPLAPISRVILRGKVTLEAGLLGHLSEHGIGMLFLTGRQGRPSLLLGRAHNDAQRRVAQTRLSLDSAFCLGYARQLIHSKIARQIEWFNELRSHYPQARYPLTHALRQLQEQQGRLPQATLLESLRGLEGAAAASYFAGLRAVVPASWGFNERNRRPPRDPFNALISLTYTLVMAETAMALHTAGYDPCIGYYHQLSHARESLACDLLEPLRPLADRLCLRLVAQETLTAGHFSTSDAGCLLGKAGRARFYAAYEENALPLRRALREEVKTLARLVSPDLPEPSTMAVDDPADAPWCA
ncbi:MAG: CRISPR-associated endonuclease Cas1 [Burkholderiales bacterium]|nr:CRISPR-associated endonuclease Cas1 [Burkholderiales bacterium]